MNYDFYKLLHSAVRVYNFLWNYDKGNYDSRFVDSDGDGFEADMVYLLEGLHELVDYCSKKLSQSADESEDVK